jgi:hypothetical protein
LTGARAWPWETGGRGDRGSGVYKAKYRGPLKIQYKESSITIYRHRIYGGGIALTILEEVEEGETCSIASLALASQPQIQALRRPQALDKRGYANLNVRYCQVRFFGNSLMPYSFMPHTSLLSLTFLDILICLQ